MSARDTISPAAGTAGTGTTSGRQRPAAPGFLRTSLLVAERDVTLSLHSKSFLISTGILLLLVLGSILLSGLIGGDDEGTEVAVTTQAAELLAGTEGLTLVEVADEAEARELVLSEEVEAAVVTDDDPANPLGLLVLAGTDTPQDVVAALSVSPPVELLDEAGADFLMRYLISFAFGIVFMLAASIFGGAIAQSVVEEKQTRIVEILLSAVPARAMLAGKILGNSLLAFGQIAAIAAVCVVGLTMTGQGDLLGMLGAPLVWFVIFFVVGFVLLAAMFAAGASMVSRVEDVATVTAPATMLIMIPYFVVIFFNDNPTVLTIMSYVPFSAPVGMPVRMFFGDASWWEPLVSLVLLIGTTVGVIAVGARIYANSLLRTGPRVQFRDALRGGS